MLSAFPFVRAWRRRRLARRPFPERWHAIVDERLPFAARLPEEDREPFRTHLKVFVWEKHWAGAGGLEITEEMQVVIAGSAARLVRRLPLDVYDRLTEVVVYPGHYHHPEGHETIVLGEAHHFGTVVLSWNAVTHGIDCPRDGLDTALHEFAHVLDIADGTFDGTPLLEHGSDYPAWSRVMGAHFARLQDSPARHFLRPYGALNEAEFFAVATEAFFEQPHKLRRHAPDLYTVLADFFGVDPV